MSRSIHSTHRELHNLRREQFADPDVKRAEVRSVRKALRLKQRVKLQVSESRALPKASLDAVPPSVVPVVVPSPAQYVHFPASEQDILGIIRALPPGSTDGIHSVALSLGEEEQREEREDGDEVDPFVGRYGSCVLPGVHGPLVLGMYLADGARVMLYAYVYEPALPHREIKETWVRLCMLSTLVHEIGHHHDFTRRVARGRWRADERVKKEIFAERAEHDWTHSVVLPYLERNHTADVNAFLDWVEQHGGVRLALGFFAEDPRRTRKDGFTGIAFSIRSALSSLIEDVENGNDPWDTRFSFAVDLHYADRFTEARQVLDRMNAERENDPEVLCQLADLDYHEDRYDRAVLICRDVLSRTPDFAEAWSVLEHVYFATRAWEGVLETTTQLLSLAEPGWQVHSAHRSRARALLELGDYAGLCTEITCLTATGMAVNVGWAQSFQALLYLRTEQWQEALDLAVNALQASTVPRQVELCAVRFEAAMRLGRADEAIPLPASWVGSLRARGFEGWVDRLTKHWGERLIVAEPPRAHDRVRT